MNGYSDEVLQEIDRQVGEWYDAFATTNLFTSLPESAQEDAWFITSVFSERMYTYCLQTPEEWSVDALKEVVGEVFPRKVSGTEQLFDSVEPVLRAFFQYLSDMDYLNNSISLVQALKEIAPTMLKQSKDSTNWGMAKQFVMAAISSGVDLHNKEDLDMFTAEYNENIRRASTRSTTKVGRNETCPCGSGKKYKRCCGRGS